LLFNGLSAGLALIGAIVGLVASSSFTGFTTFMIPFAAGSFLYIAGSNLVPELHKHCSLKESALHIIAMAAGIGIMVALLFIAPGHIH
ncbi:MAG: ZIP family metal transporter, partial [Anaerolineales bacterium]|nr:ZIP family metal transporter [Anaerolineales bacterium]